MRNIDPELFEDNWVQSLSDRDFSAWVLLISSMCDDHGRFELNLVRLRTRVFRSRLVSDDEIRKVLNEFAEAKKISIYLVNGKQYCQVLNWWKYQFKSSYMKESKYPAPEGWCDRFHYTGKGRKSITSQNWSSGGAGFVQPANSESL